LLEKFQKSTFNPSLAQGGGREWHGDKTEKPNRHAHNNEETEEGAAIKSILAKANKSSWEIVQCAYFPGAGFHEIFSLFPSTKAFNVERILLTFTR
jgi:hypothetical protein